jgi:hypothetical protein
MVVLSKFAKKLKEKQNEKECVRSTLCFSFCISAAPMHKFEPIWGRFERDTSFCSKPLILESAEEIMEKHFVN